MAWVKTPTTWANSYPQIVSDAGDGNTVNGWNLYVYRPNGENRFSFILKVIDWGSDWVQATFSAATDTWYHVVGVREGTSVKLYINGVLNNTDAGNSGNMVYSANPRVEIGTKTASNTGSTAWKGIIDEVRIYNRALSDSEIKALYDATK